MSGPAISVRNLSKCYRLGTIGRHTLGDEWTYWWHRLRGRDPRAHMGQIRRGAAAREQRRLDAEELGAKEFWALRDVSFDVSPGEVVGIIGRNGAGKSTLLKILSRITEPSEGEAFLDGRLGSLLEVGTGFHPELTGRDNIFMNGTILGMKRAEIAAKFDEIVAFSETGQFIDTPVKRYSSGMYVRLAFAVAAHLDTEIMLVDEVLAVGDVAFQKKCLGKMKDIAGAGRTVLFVSHSMAAVANLCSRVLLIDQGGLTLDGDPDSVIARYLDRNLIEGAVASEKEIEARIEGVIKRDFPYFRITEIRLEDQHGMTRSVFDSAAPVVVSVSFRCYQMVRDLRVLVAVADENGAPVYGSQNMDDCETAKMFYSMEPGSYMTKCVLPADIFGNRKYHVNVDVVCPKTEHHVLTKVLEFQVAFPGYNPDIQYGGNNLEFLLWPRLSWVFKRLDERQAS